MTAKDRQEVREIFKDIMAGYMVSIQGYVSSNNAQYIATDGALDKIDKHLEKLNGTVAEHEKKILQELPHTIANCPQQDKIQNIRDNMVSNKAIQKAIYTGIIATGAIASILFILYQVFK